MASKKRTDYACLHRRLKSRTAAYEVFCPFFSMRWCWTPSRVYRGAAEEPRPVAWGLFQPWGAAAPEPWAVSTGLSWALFRSSQILGILVPPRPKAEHKPKAFILLAVSLAAVPEMPLGIIAAEQECQAGSGSHRAGMEGAGSFSGGGRSLLGSEVR